MKKVLLSLAVIAASGGYVAFENAASQAGAGPGLAGTGAALMSSTALPSVPADSGGRGASGALALVGPAKAADAKVNAPAAAGQTATPVAQGPSPSRPAADSAPAAVQVRPADPASVQVAAAPPAASAAPAPTPTPTEATPAVAATTSAPVPEPAPSWRDPQSPVQVADATPPPVTTTPAAPPLPRPRPADAPTAVADRQTTSSILVAQAGYRDGTFRGPSENAYYGRVQLSAEITGGQIKKIDILDYPNDRRRSQYISSVAIPMLEQEAIQAQSANIDIVSGATLTSEAFIHSLDAALAGARG